MSRANVYLVRHAEPIREHDADGRLVERLTESGIAETRRLAARLAAEWGLPQTHESGIARAEAPVIYASPWPRSRETAALISAVTGAPVFVDDDLQERKLRLDAGRAAPPANPAGESPDALHARALDCLRGALQANPGRRLVLVTHNRVIAALARALGASGFEPLPYCGMQRWYVPEPPAASARLRGERVEPDA